MKKIDLYESENIEFKEDFNEVTKDRIFATLRAFNNASGGVLYVGIKDNREIAGVDLENMDSITCKITNAFTNIFVNLKINIENHANKKILKIAVEEEKNVIYENDGYLWIRKNASNKKLKGQEIQNFLSSKNSLIKDVNKNLFENFDLKQEIDWKLESNFVIKKQCKKIFNILLNFKIEVSPILVINLPIVWIQIIRPMKFVNNQICVNLDLFVQMINTHNLIESIPLNANSIFGKIYCIYVDSIKICINKEFCISSTSYLFNENISKNSINIMKNQFLENLDYELKKNDKNAFKIVQEIKKIHISRISEYTNNKNIYRKNIRNFQVII